MDQQGVQATHQGGCESMLGAVTPGVQHLSSNTSDAPAPLLTAAAAPTHTVIKDAEGHRW